MSSSQTFLPSSQVSLTIGGTRRKSQFTWKQLSQLSTYSTTCPLRVIAHIDLDAFYAQCEMVRLGVAEDQPLAVQQWQGLIAINYPARKYGMNRHINISEAKKLCPEIIMQHVATWKEGEEKWRYHEDAFANMGTHKVSLDPYRMESRKILARLKNSLPENLQKVEKASIDEVFLDLSAQIHSIILERYPELKEPPPDSTETLPPPPTSALDWQADALVDLNNDATDDDDPDWDDICMLIGSEIVRSLRANVWKELQYTCSAGLAKNKMLAKLGSGYKKPNQQTVIRNRAISQFLEGFKFTKIRNLGGKLGDEVVEAFGTEEVKELLQVPIEQLKKRVGDDTGSWIHRIIRGEDASEVSSRTQIKSMLSAKSFRPSINTHEQAIRWLRIFSADIFSRLVEEGVLVYKRRPKTMNLHHRQGAQTRSKSIPIPTGKMIDEMMLFDLAKTLLGQVILDGRAWPCANLSLSVSGFEEGPSGNKGIGSFLLHGKDAQTVNATRLAGTASPGQDGERPEKRRRLEDGGIQGFFRRTESRDEEDEDFERVSDSEPRQEVIEQSDNAQEVDELVEEEGLFISDEEHDQEQTYTDKYFCRKCSKAIPVTDQAEHEDWHFAKELHDSEHPRSNQNQAMAWSSKSAPKKLGQTKTAKLKKTAGGLVPEKGQAKLKFDR